MPELDEELKDKETENLQDIDNAGEAGKEDELLSDAEIKRIADMNLDDIIEDATSDSVSVEDLFGNGDSAAEASQENADEPVQAASQPEEKSDKASAEQAEAVQKQPDTTAAEAEQTETAGTQTEKSEPAGQAETQTQAEPGKEQEAAGSENQSDKKKKDKKAKKAKKDKKGFFSAVRDIFFESVEEEPEEQTIFEVVENMPDFPGGQAALMQYLAKNIKYPTIAQENGTQGRVIVQFVVNKDGSIVDAKVVRSVDPYLDKEALRVINTMPKWKPGMQRGKPVRVKFTVPVMFRLQ